MKKISKIFLTSALVLSNAVFLSFPAAAETTYTLASPVPSVENIGTVSEGVSTASSRVMWRGSNGNIHILAAFSDSNWQAIYVNLTTGAHALVNGFKGDARSFAYHPGADRLYISGKYGAGLAEFNPDTMTATLIAEPSPGGTGSLSVGDDGLVYFSTTGDLLFSYDPTKGYPAGWKEYGLLHPSSLKDQYSVAAADTAYVYASIQFADGHHSLVISPTSGDADFQEWEFGSAGDTDLNISLNEGSDYDHSEHIWTVTRTLSDGSFKFYRLHDGTYTEIALGQTGYYWSGNPPRTLQTEYHREYSPQRCYAGGSDSSTDQNFSNTYDWEVNFDDLFPIKNVHEYSTLRYRQTGETDWNEAAVTYTGPWVANIIQAIVPEAGNDILAVSEGYNATLNLDYQASDSDYLGAHILSPYSAMHHPSGEIYVGGYANRVLRYDPEEPWTLSPSSSTSRLPSDAGKPNPYFIKMSGDTIHYRHGLDYDSSGIVWIGGNTTRLSLNYGDVMWYDPSNGNTGYMFPEWETPGTQFRNLVAAANRTKIVVTANNNKLYVINAATKTVDGSYDLDEYAYMADVDGIVVGVTTSGKIFRFNPLTRTMITPPQSIGVSGTPFGWGDNRYTRMNYKLEKGPDNYLWMFVGNSLYRINPTTLQFSKVIDTTYGKIEFAVNNTDLLIYDNGTDFKYIPGLLVASQTFRAADLNEDDAINATDLNILKNDFLRLTGSLGNAKSDIDGDGQATIKDVGIMMSGW